jgi:hypothetical protein
MKNWRSWAYETPGADLLVGLSVARLHDPRTGQGGALMPSNRHRERLATAHQDALMLATWRANGIIPSRRYAAIYGITQNRFENAIGLLRLARIVVRQRTWVTDDLATIKRQLKQAKEYALETPKAYHARLTAHAQT